MDLFPSPPSIYMTIPPRRRRWRRARLVLLTLGAALLGTVICWIGWSCWIVLTNIFPLGSLAAPMAIAIPAPPSATPASETSPTPVPTLTPTLTPTPTPAAPLAAATPAIDPARVQAFLGRLRGGLSAAKPSASGSASDPAAGWSLATIPVRNGEIQARLAWVAVGRVPLKDDRMETPVYSPQAYLGINMELANLSQTRKIDYQSWAGDQAGTAPENNARLRDSFGNTYRLIALNPVPLGRTARASLYPGQRISDLLIFEPPVQGALQFILELPAANFGGEGMIRLIIPASMIQYAR